MESGLPDAAIDFPMDLDSPRRHITAPRQFLSDRPIPDREDSLQLQVDELRALTRKWQRIITNLTYRHLMEHLPGSNQLNAQGKPCTTSTDRWKSFVAQALQKAHEADEASSHPLAKALTRFSSKAARRQLETVGKDLYGTVSANIYAFNAEYQVPED